MNANPPTCRASLTLFLVLLLGATTWSAKAPLSDEDLHDEADLILVGTVLDIVVVTEQAELEPAKGNLDWAIYLTLQVDRVEKGKTDVQEIRFRCFRSKMRRSYSEYMTPGGHFPIPALGSHVRAFLIPHPTANWQPIYPNGIQSSDGNPLEEAVEVEGLHSGAFTYGLPLGGWVAVAGLGGPLFLLGLFAIWWLRQRRRRLARQKNPFAASGTGVPS